MATLFFARSGNDPSRTDKGREISMELILEQLGRKEIKYSENPPVINAHEQPSPYSDFIHVVIEVGDDEINNKFTKPGYYWLPGLSPNECLAALGSINRSLR